MEEYTRADSGATALPAERNTWRYYYTKRNDCISMGLKRPALDSKQALSSADAISSHASPCNGQFEAGAFYEIDHEKLPPKSPIQLKAIRVVKVSETTRLDVTVSFPSTLSLRNYFSGGPAGGFNGSPELDERFVMSSNQATRILRKLIPSSILDEEKHLESFWFVAPKANESTPGQLWAKQMVEVEEMMEWQGTSVGGCLLALKCAGVTGWGVRRKVKYIGRHREMPSSSWNTKVEEVEEQRIGMKQSPDRKEERERQQIGKKRIRESCKNERKKKKKGDRREKKKPRHDKEEATKGEMEEPGSPVRGFTDRWSSERYEAAEIKLLEITRELGAELGNPILRQALRDEARKHIGDTGLLDHLLKHMAGKIVGGGAERFRRRHNTEGAMEYWLEPADLEEIRRKAGVADPYWVPPPGWKLGDGIYTCPCGADCKREITLVKEQNAVLKRDVEQLSALVKLENQAREAQSESDNGCNNWQDDYKGMLEWKTKAEEGMAQMSSCFQSLKEDYQSLLQWKIKVEEEMAGRASCLQALTEEMNGKREDSEKAVDVVTEKKGRGDDGDDKVVVTNTNLASTNNDSSCNTTTPTPTTTTTSNDTIIIITGNSSCGDDNNNDIGGASGGGKVMRGVRRSGFRICKPQGTFLWPDMGGSSAAGISSSRDGTTGVVPPTSTSASTTTTTLEDHLIMLFGVPTPPSASSSTSAPKLPNLTSSPVLPEGMVVPSFPSQPPRGDERTGSSENICPSSVYCNMALARASSAAMVGSTGGGSGRCEGKKREALAASWERERGGGWSNMITTDLALATPTSYL